MIFKQLYLISNYQKKDKERQHIYLAQQLQGLKMVFLPLKYK